MIWHFDVDSNGPIYCRARMCYGMFRFQIDLISLSKFIFRCQFFAAPSEWKMMIGVSLLHPETCTDIVQFINAPSIKSCLLSCEVCSCVILQDPRNNRIFSESWWRLGEGSGRFICTKSQCILKFIKAQKIKIPYQLCKYVSAELITKLIFQETYESSCSGIVIHDFINALDDYSNYNCSLVKKCAYVSDLLSNDTLIGM